MSEFLLKSYKQNGGVKREFNCEKRSKATWGDRKINFDACKTFNNIEVFKTEILKVVTKVKKNVIIQLLVFHLEG